MRVLSNCIMKSINCWLQSISVCLLACFLSNVSTQRVSLRNPPPLEPGSVTTYDSQSKVGAKAGDVLVHFDKKNEIQQIQYVLRDGRLATLYQRKPTDFYGRGSDPLPNAISFVHRRSEQAAALAPEASTSANTPASSTPIGIPSSETASQQDPSKVPPQTINGEAPNIVGIGMNDPVFGMLNTKLASLSQLTGTNDKPITVVVPDRKIFPMNIDLSQFPVAGMPLSDKIDILATVASDAAQVTAPLRKAMMDKLRSKVSQKIRELPGIIEAKLRAKSSVGHLILEKAASRYVPVVDGKLNHPLPALGSKTSKYIMVPEVPVELPSNVKTFDLQYPGFVQPPTKLSNQVLQDSGS